MTIQNFDNEQGGLRRRRGLRVALRPRRPVLDVLRGDPDENYLRGVQEADADGEVTFTTIFPACYSGRWPHIHFEVYPSLAKATNSANKIATSQIALPEDACNAVYATAGYEQSVQNMSQVSLDSDNVFSDGYDLQLPGSPAARPRATS